MRLSSTSGRSTLTLENEANGLLSGPHFVVSHKHVEHYRSPVYDRAKRGDLSLLMVLTQPVIICGDVMVEFFNKPKMLGKPKVGSSILL